MSARLYAFPTPERRRRQCRTVRVLVDLEMWERAKRLREAEALADSTSPGSSFDYTGQPDPTYPSGAA